MLNQEHNILFETEANIENRLTHRRLGFATDSLCLALRDLLGTVRYFCSAGAKQKWTKITADSVTLSNGTSADGVANLRTAFDGSFYHIDEAAGTPGIRLIVDFINVPTFNWVNIIAIYKGSTTHAVGIQLYNWTSAAWDTFANLQTGQENVTSAGEYILENKDFSIADDTNYIGTGADAGKVRVRFNHTMAGNAAHDVWIDVVALYR